MRRVLVVVVSLVALLGLVTPPASAQAPAPKVTITGLVDLVSTYSKNWSSMDPTNSQDKEWYSRERGVFTLTGEVGKTKGVWAIELDFVNGCIGNVEPAAAGNDGGCAAGHGTTSSFDMDTDVQGAVETKWLYLETPITGPGSLMPFIPVPTIMRGGAQPARGHDYKNGILLSGDFPGVTLETTWAPNLRSTISYVQIQEQMDTISVPGATEDWAIVTSVEWDIFKGLTVKPTYAYAQYFGGNTGTSNLGTEAKNGFNQNGISNLELHRHTIGGDVRWTYGGFSLQPTFLYQFGKQSTPPATSDGKTEVDINSYIIDAIAGYRIGPLNIEGRVMFTPGMDATDCVTADGGCPVGSRGQKIKYYQPINSGFGYMAGWTEIQTSGVDYSTALFVPAGGVTLRQSPSYDKYGRIFVALGADYSFTPAFTVRGTANASWTDKKVDTNGNLSANGLRSPTGGDENYLGTEFDLGFTYRFAPNIAFDLIGAYMWTGAAMNNGGCTGTCSSTGNTGAQGVAAGTPRDADDVYKVVARMRFTF